MSSIFLEPGKPDYSSFLHLFFIISSRTLNAFAGSKSIERRFNMAWRVGDMKAPNMLVIPQAKEYET